MHILHTAGLHHGQLSAPTASAISGRAPMYRRTNNSQRCARALRFVHRFTNEPHEQTSCIITMQQKHAHKLVTIQQLSCQTMPLHNQLGECSITSYHIQQHQHPCHRSTELPQVQQQRTQCISCIPACRQLSHIHSTHTHAAAFHSSIQSAHSWQNLRRSNWSW